MQVPAISDPLAAEHLLHSDGASCGVDSALARFFGGALMSWSRGGADGGAGGAKVALTLSGAAFALPALGFSPPTICSSNRFGSAADVTTRFRSVRHLSLRSTLVRPMAKKSEESPKMSAHSERLPVAVCFAWPSSRLCSSSGLHQPALSLGIVARALPVESRRTQNALYSCTYKTCKTCATSTHSYHPMGWHVGGGRFQADDLSQWHLSYKVYGFSSASKMYKSLRARENFTL